MAYRDELTTRYVAPYLIISLYLAEGPVVDREDRGKCSFLCHLEVLVWTEGSVVILGQRPLSADHDLGQYSSLQK